MLLLTLLEKGGLNHIIFLLIVGAIKLNASPKPLSFKASLYGFIDSSEISLLDDVLDICFSTDFGNCLRMLVGWLECLFYKLAYCFLCEMLLYTLLYKSNATSRKSTAFKLHCIMIDKLHALETLTIAFFFLSISGLEIL